MPPKPSENKPAAKDYSAYTVEQFIAELNASLAAQAENLKLAEMAEEKNEELTAKVTSLETSNALLSSEKLELQAENEQLRNEVAELKEELVEEESKNPNKKEKFEWKGITYEVLVNAAKLPGVSEQALTAQEICASDEAKKKLVESKSSLIRELK